MSGGDPTDHEPHEPAPLVSGPARVRGLRDLDEDAADFDEGVTRRWDATRPAPRRRRWLRLVFLLSGVGVIAAMFMFANGGLREPPAAIDVALLAAGIEVVDPRFVGLTARGEPLHISADVARPDGPDPEHIALEGVRGEVRLQDGRLVSLRADAGDWSQSEQRVLLTGEVVIESDDGYSLLSDRLSLDTQELIVVSDGPVEGEGPTGRITADSMRLSEDEGGRAYFEGSVRVTLTEMTPSRARGPDAAPPDESDSADPGAGDGAPSGDATQAD